MIERKPIDQRVMILPRRFSYQGFELQYHFSSFSSLPFSFVFPNTSCWQVNNHSKNQLLFLALFFCYNFILTGFFCKSLWLRCHLSPILSLHSPCSAWMWCDLCSTMTSSVMKEVHISPLYPGHEWKYQTRFQLQLPTLSLSFTVWETLAHQ